MISATFDERSVGTTYNMFAEMLNLSKQIKYCDSWQFLIGLISSIVFWHDNNNLNIHEW